MTDAEEFYTYVFNAIKYHALRIATINASDKELHGMGFFRTDVTYTNIAGRVASQVLFHETGEGYPGFNIES